MSKRSIKSQVYKTLLSRSGNKCAFPGCTHLIFNHEFKFVAQLCHIEAVSEGGERYNCRLTPEEINGYENLIFLCGKHHVETNDVNVYTVELMKQIKRDHEQKYVISPFTVDMAHIFSLKREMEFFWSQVEEVNAKEHVVPDLKIAIDTKADYTELNDKTSETLQSLENLIRIIEEHEQKKYWEIFCLGFPNHINVIKVLLEHMNIKYHEEKLVANPHDLKLKDDLNRLKRNFLDTAKRSGYLD